MKNQVTSIEQSKQLLELGVPADKASMAWAQCSGEWHLSVLPHYTANKEYIDSGISIPAFTVADLLYVLPKILHDNRGNALPLNVTTSTDSYWCLFWGNWGTHKGWEDSASIVDLLTTAVEWVVSNGYKLNV